MRLGTKYYALFIVGVALLACFMILFWRQQQNNHQSMRQIKLTIAGVTLDTWVARTVAQQTQGLSDRTTLGANEAMLFPYDDLAVRHFWMKDMRLPIDILWLKDGVVVGWQADVPPPTGLGTDPARMVSPQAVNGVLEVSAGFVNRFGVAQGDRVVGLTDF